MPESNIHTVERKTVGSRLREARELKGLSLEDVARTTRISKGYLKALEEDDLEKLPSEAYAKGFRRVYTQFLNLAVEEQPVQHEQDSLGCQKTGDYGDSTSIQSCSERTLSARTFWRAAVAFSLLILIVLSTAFFCSSTKKPLVPQTIAPTSKPVEAKIEAGPVQVNSGSIAADKPLSVSQKDEEPLSPKNIGVGEETLVLRLKVVEDGALDITVDDAITQHYDLKAGDLIEWKGEKSFSLDIENAGAVEAELNGKPLKSFGEKGAFAHIVLSAGYNERKAGR
jgi:cytoskeletal protein RodZ